MQNIETLASGHWYRIPSHCALKPKEFSLFNCAGSEPQQAPLYYLLIAGWQKLIDLPIQPPYRGDIDSALYFNLHSPALANDHTANHGFVLWLRYPSIMLGVLTLLMSFLALRLITADPWTPAVGTAILAFIPRFVFLAAFVTNDIMVAFLGACLMYVSLRFAITPCRWRMVLVGAVYGLLVATKLSALPMGLVIVMAALLVAGWKRRAEFLALAGAGALAVSGSYLIQNIVRYGDPLALRATIKYQTAIDGLGNTDGHPYVVTDPLKLIFVKVPQQIVHSIWFQSGWGQFNWPSWINWTISVFVLVLIATLVRDDTRKNVLPILGVLAVSGLLCVWVTSFSTGTYAARYAIGGVPAIAALLAIALERWRLPMRFVVPILGLVGTVVAIQVNVLDVRWS